MQNFNVTNRPDSWDASTATKNFIAHVDNEIKKRPDLNWREIDLVIRSHNDIYVKILTGVLWM